MTVLSGADWRKSTRSANNNTCVEVATNLVGQGVVGVRDSKDPHGGTLAVGPGAFTVFLGFVKKEHVDNG